MADIHSYVLCRLVTVLYLLTGVSGDTRSLYTRVGDHVNLSCTNVVYPDCSSTTWIYHRNGLQSVIEKVAHGKIKTTSERAGKLKVGSDCSLHVSDVRAEDAGTYTCQQFLTMGGSQHGGDDKVQLSVLTNSSSSPITDIKPDKPITFWCFLYTFNGPGICSSGITEHVSLVWWDDSGKHVKNDSRHQITESSHCNITLTVTLQKEDNNRKWTCQMNIDGRKEISIDFNLMVTGGWAVGVAVGVTVGVTVGVAVGVAVCVAAVIILHRRRNKNQMPSYQGPARNKDLGLTAVNFTSPTSNEDMSEPADSITYASIGHINKNPPQNVDAHGEAAVTYAALRTSSEERKNPADPNSLYASVIKPQGAKTST